MDDSLIYILESKGIDVQGSLDILPKLNQPQKEKVDVQFADPNDPRIINMEDISFSLSQEEMEEAKRIYPPLGEKSFIFEKEKNTYKVDRDMLYFLGLSLLPQMAYGILNGGSATSFVDRKKNMAFCPEIFPVYQKELERYSQLYGHKPKGICPAYLEKNGNYGPSFIHLKILGIIRLGYEYLDHFGSPPSAPALFQMTSESTDQSIGEYLEELFKHPEILNDLKTLGWESDFFFQTGKQKLLTTYCLHQSKDMPFFLLDQKNTSSILALPGGHGQNFRVLKQIYFGLWNKGYRFAYLGNVDNIAYLPDPIAMAFMALKNSPASFEFSKKTQLDIKGGVLVQTKENRLTNRDLGSALSSEELSQWEKRGKEVFFNCATGLFSLSFLRENIDFIINELPLRISKQDKDIGQYLQAEQVTWEVMDLLDNPLIFAVNKYKRFLSAKIIMETFLTSGLNLDQKEWDKNEGTIDLKAQAEKLHKGLAEILDHSIQKKIT